MNTSDLQLLLFLEAYTSEREGTVKPKCDLLMLCTLLVTFLLFAQIYKGYGAEEEQSIYICTPKLFSMN